MSINMLPTNVLVKIFDHLPFKERVRIRIVNRLFREVSDESINTMRSLVINDELLEYVFMTQQFSYLLESCSPTLESIDATSPLFNKSWFKAMAQFDYPRLKNLTISVIDNGRTGKLIGRCGNLQSIALRLSDEFEWPENMAFDNLQRLEIHPTPAVIDESINRGYVNLSSILRPLIGNVPNLKQIWIRSDWNFQFIFPVQELSQLMASASRLEGLDLELFGSLSDEPPFLKMYQDFEAAISTWYMPNLTTLRINFGGLYGRWSSIIHKFPLLFPRLKSFTASTVKKIDDQAIVALSHLENLRVLCMPYLEVSKEKFTQMITWLPSIAVLSIDSVGSSFTGQDLEALSRMKYLREFSIGGPISKDEFIEMITSVPSIGFLHINAIYDVSSPEEFIEFVTSTAAQIQRGLEIYLSRMEINGNNMQLGQMEVVLEEMKNNGGPVVEVKRIDDMRFIEWIRYP